MLTDRVGETSSIKSKKYVRSPKTPKTTQQYLKYLKVYIYIYVYVPLFIIKKKKNITKQVINLCINEIKTTFAL